jgi:hypothetical protein
MLNLTAIALILCFAVNLCSASAHAYHPSKTSSATSKRYGRARSFSGEHRNLGKGKGSSKKQPTVSPSPTISVRPSIAPTVSHAPTISIQPSGAPSVSHAPTVNVISGKKPLSVSEGYDGVQNGCPVPNEADASEFAEATVKRIVVQFVYMVKYKSTGDKDAILKALDLEIPQFVYDNYISCPKTSDGFVLDKPIGVSSSPNDSIATDLKCSKVAEGESCVVVDAEFNLIFPSSASINESLEEDAVLDFVKNSMAAAEARARRNMQGNVEFSSSNTDVTGVVFVGSRDDVSFPETSIVSSALGDGDGFGSGGISAVGGVLVGAAILVVLAALFAADRRRKRRISELNDSTLRNKSGYAEYEAGSLDGDSDGMTMTPTSSPERVKFPISHADSNPSSTRYQTQNVHHCKSATCKICKASSDPEFIRLNALSAWDDEVEGDFPTEGFNIEPGSRGLHDEFSDRKYETQNTVTL